jgi:serine/threonine protein kinase
MVGGMYAMKVLRKSHLLRRRQIERTKTERRVLGRLDHVFIMKLHYAFQSQEKLYLVLDYCPGGELFFHLSRYRRFPERVARFYAAELTTAIGHLHSVGIIYRDLKPENVLLDADGHVKLGDFGLAKDGIDSPTKGATSMCGTPEYMAPEVLCQKGHGFTVDWWGLGMLTYEVSEGQRTEWPFNWSARVENYQHQHGEIFIVLSNPPYSLISLRCSPVFPPGTQPIRQSFSRGSRVLSSSCLTLLAGRVGPLSRGSWKEIPANGWVPRVSRLLWTIVSSAV